MALLNCANYTHVNLYSGIGFRRPRVSASAKSGTVMCCDSVPDGCEQVWIAVVRRLFCTFLHTFPIFLLDQIATVYSTLSLFTSHPVPRVNTPTYYALVMSTPFPYTPTQSPHHSDPYLFTSIGY